MALTLLSQHPKVLDFQQIFDIPSNQTQQSQQQSQLSYYSLQQFQQLEKSDNSQMEFNNSQTTVSHQHQHHHHNHHQTQSSAQQQHNLKGNNHNHNNTTTNTNNKNNDNISDSENINQNLSVNRNYISGYHHQHIGSDYEQVINFVDSPPNSEESWTDEQSKGSPGPQIIDVQTIFSNSGTRKRRMDWDSLDINQNDSSATVAHTRDITNKSIDHHHHHQDKDRQKREKLTERGSWTDDIGFDLNAEFNSNSYLNNEPFLSFSPALTVPKQEPQSEHLLKSHKSPLNPVENIQLKIDKTVAQSPNHCGGEQQQQNGKHEIIDNNCDSPSNNNKNNHNNPTTNVDKQNNNNSTICQNSANYSLNKCHTHNNAVIQQLSVIDATKIESAKAAITTKTTIASSSSSLTTGTNNNNNNSNNSNAAIYSDEHKFQYILAAATSIATKNNEETLTYLNQGQSYEIKLKKIGDLSLYRDKILKSVIKICFHERRLQFMEREQMQLWQASRPGERIIEVDVPLSYGLCHVTQQMTSSGLNTVEVFWDPLKEVGVYIKVNCISTEFTAKKHGGEKGVPFRLQIETYIENSNASTSALSASASVGGVDCTADNITNNVPQSPNNNNNTLTTLNSNNNNNNNNNQQLSNKQLVHAAACQIKVFKLKGADRKHKQDREKVLKRPQSEQEKFQPSYECTIMNDIPLDLMMPTTTCYSPEYLKIWPNSPVHIPKYDGILPYATNPSPTANSSPIAINSVTSTNSPTMKLMDTNIVSPPQSVVTDMDDYMCNIMPDSTPAQVAQWLGIHRLTAYLTTFAHFSGSDIMRMSKDDLIQICGLADGIRMFNILRAKAITPRLTIYVSLDGNQSYQAIYLISHTAKELTQKLFKLPGFYEMVANGGQVLENGNPWGMHSKYSGSGTNIFHEVVYIVGPAGVHVTVTDDVLCNEIKDGSLYVLEVQNGKVVIKFANKNDN